ncbi:hypothetical protein [Desulfonatronovibrio hydrogenovorans]|uniref:hypothetical protein n=1 Tax=Desulfonatronovibrio hydrogenovorans TaxID=53245 RepID=UPI00048DC885|nr:hypothetical protein [Desulfonatronovibrio hydrogenovorans]
MLWFHPLLQLLATIAAFYVLLLGWERFKGLHLGKKTRFNWKGHVFWGRLVIIVWLAGLVLGKVAVNNHFGMSGIFLNHNQGAMIMTPFMLVAYLTGSIMDRRRKKRIWLPAIHGANNIVLICLALYQAYTGYLIITNFLLA